MVRVGKAAFPVVCFGKLQKLGAVDFNGAGELGQVSRLVHAPELRRRKLGNALAKLGPINCLDRAAPILKFGIWLGCG